MLNYKDKQKAINSVKTDEILKAVEVANDALYPSYGDSWRNEIDTGPTDPEPGEPVFGTDETGQTFFEFVRSLQINPQQLAHGIHQEPTGWSYPSQEHHDPAEHQQYDPGGGKLYNPLDGGDVVPWDQRPTNDLTISHNYREGPTRTLTDIINIRANELFNSGKKKEAAELLKIGVEAYNLEKA